MGWNEIAGYQVMKQADGFSCGMACVAMVVHRVQATKPTEAAVKQMSMQAGSQSYTPALSDRAAFRQAGPRMLTATSAAPAPDAGTGMKNLSNILTLYKLKNTLNNGDVLSCIQQARSGSPVLAIVQWNGGGGNHFVVIESFSAGAPKPVIICDPIYGVSATALMRNYAPAAGVSGNFLDWAITT